MGNEGLFLRLMVGFKLSPLSAAADQARHLHLVDADYSSIHDSHVPSLILLAGRFQVGAQILEVKKARTVLSSSSSFPLVRINILSHT